MLEVQAKQCETCIYRRSTHFDTKALEAQIADPKMAGYFIGFRVCHHAPRGSQVCCRGFWNRHKDHFTAGQLAQRLRLVAFVTVDKFKKKPRVK